MKGLKEKKVWSYLHINVVAGYYCKAATSYCTSRRGAIKIGVDEI